LLTASRRSDLRHLLSRPEPVEPLPCKLITLDPPNSEETAMDKDRIKGSVQQAKGAVKEAAGKVFGDQKLETEGKSDKAVGKVQNAIGGLKDAVRGK
jgi:uncharacterized protein YjbJ (UPF0337 family)